MDNMAIFKVSASALEAQKARMNTIASNLANVGIKADIKLWEGGAWYEAHIGKKLRGFITRNSWYDAEQNAGADLQDGYMQGMPWAYVTTKEISDDIKKTMAARSDKEAADLGRKLSKLIRESRINMHLWSQHANYGTSQRIVQWDQQLGTFPSTRFEYMKIKD